MTDTMRPSEAYGNTLRDSLEVARAEWDAERARLEARAAQAERERDEAREALAVARLAARVVTASIRAAVEGEQP